MEKISRSLITLVCVLVVAFYLESCSAYENTWSEGSVWGYRNGRYVKLRDLRDGRRSLTLKSLSPPASSASSTQYVSPIRYSPSYQNEIETRPWWWQRCGVCPYGYVRRWGPNDIDVECGQCKPIAIGVSQPRCGIGYTPVEGICTRNSDTCMPGYEWVGGRCQLIYTWQVPARKHCPGCYCSGSDCPCADCHQQLEAQERYRG